ncbi:flagellar hook-basal body complex protein [Lacrimispora sp. BS-2]|uniref:Flagellar hook protein FlgE n=1 Tax=Lacrimispora sp. BS-2 TaxID=3151850 RepID=A0AAU7PP79_9FIRM
MVKSMFAGVAGLRTHQAKMDVIGNNIANVNTWGFKAGTMSFKDTMYQNTSAGSKGSTSAGGYGGTNANQVGYGVTTGSITYDFSMGSPSPSSRGLDCYIDGTGFYIVGPMVGNGEGFSLEDKDVISSKGLSLSRVGKFDVDNQGYLVDDSGNYIYGFENTNTSDLSQGTFNTTTLKPLRIPMTSEIAAIGDKNAVNKVEAARKELEGARANLNKLNLELGKAREEYIAVNDEYETKYNNQGIKAKTDAVYDPQNGSKVLMEKAYKDWLDGKSDPAKAGDLLTAYNDAKIKYEETVNDLIVAQAVLRNNSTTSASDIAAAWGKYKTAFTNQVDASKVYDDALKAYNADPSTANKTALDVAQADLDDKKKKFAEEKKALDDLQAALSKIEPESVEGRRDAKKQAADKAKAFADAAQTAVTEAEKRLETAQNSSTSTQVENAGSSNENELARLSNYSIKEDGTLAGTSVDGSATVIIGKVALAGVQNVSGLEKTTGYYYVPGANAGSVSIYEAGGVQGRIMGNYLEMAKVDLATEMTDMITTQRGFQANSKIITVTDQMLEELVNIKR